VSGSRVAFVTGAAGSVGTRLLAVLRDSGWQTRALVHRRPVPGADEQVVGGLADSEALSQGVVGADVVLHLAALTHARRPSRYHAVNVHGTATLLAAARGAGVGRFVYVSTRAVSADGGAYSHSKLAAEEVVRGSGIEHVIVRLPEVYGAGGSEGIDQMVEKARRGAAIPVVGAGADILCPAHVDDVIAALVRSLSSTAAADRTYTLGGECRSAKEIALACARIAGSASRVVHAPVTAVRVAGIAARVLPLPLYPDQLARLRAAKPAPTPEAREDLGFTPRSLDDGLSDVLRGGS
jgi:nucleoside-diphosphate-sugar epimerase